MHGPLNVKMNVKCITVSLCPNKITQNTTFQFCTFSGPSVGTASDNEVILVTQEAWHGIYGSCCECRLTSSRYFAGQTRINKRDMHTDAQGTIMYLNGNQVVCRWPLYRGGPVSVPGQSIWDLCLEKWHQDRFFSKSIGFPLECDPTNTPHSYITNAI